jgi:hypothetical protein
MKYKCRTQETINAPKDAKKKGEWLVMLGSTRVDLKNTVNKPT